MDLGRRHLLRVGALFGIGLTGCRGGEPGAETIEEIAPTPAEIEGPFYPVIAQKDRDFDLTRIEGRDATAEGTVIEVAGQVVGTDVRPIADATVELWQANAAGRYRHPNDPSDAPLDPNFQGWAVVPSGDEGGFRFRTVFPGTYPAGRGWTRPPHLHFKVAKRGYVELVTQMYFPDHELNDVDRLLQRKPADERPLMIATRVAADEDAAEDAPERYRYRIVIEEA